MGVVDLLTADSKPNDVIEAGSLRFTTTAGYAAAITAILAGMVPVLDWLTRLEVSENLKIALLALIGAGVLGWAIASVGDVLARAYASAYMKPRKNDSDPATPLLGEFIDAYKATHSATTASVQRLYVSAHRQVVVDWRNGEAHVLAVEADPGTDKVRFLLAKPNSTAAWADAEDTTFLRFS